METKELYNKIVNNLNNGLKDIPHIHVKAAFNERFTPELQFIRIDFLDEKDYPHHIDLNSVYVNFKFDLENNTFEICGNMGHIYLTEKDQEISCLCMASLKNICKFHGLKWLRRSKINNLDKVCSKINIFVHSVYEIIKGHTYGYPYKESKVNIYA